MGTRLAFLYRRALCERADKRRDEGREGEPDTGTINRKAKEKGTVKSSGDWDWSAPPIAGLPPPAHQTGVLPVPLPGCSRGRPYLGVGFPLRCFQRLSRPSMATRRVPLARQPGHQRLVPPGPLVLGRAPLKPPAPAADRDRPVSRRSEPSSRTALMGEQPNPWDRLQPQDAMSRHRGAKRRRRWGRSGAISLFTFLRSSRRGRLSLHPRWQLPTRSAASWLCRRFHASSA